MKNAVGIALLVVGAVLLALGLQEYGTFGSQVSRALGRGPSERAWIMMIGGGICTVLGVMRVFRK